MRINYHHLYYFWAVAKDGNLTRVAAQLQVSQSSLSSQIKSLEVSLGRLLFLRDGHALKLTEAGRLTLSYAETIFTTGNDLAALLCDGQLRPREVLRIGAVCTLSRNFQENFVRPLLNRNDIELVIQSGNLTELLARLGTHRLDLVLSNRTVHSDVNHRWKTQRIARQPVSLVGKPRESKKPFKFPDDLADQYVLLPSQESDIRVGFDVLCEQSGVRLNVLAEVDDMAMLRLLAKNSSALALLPTVVVQDELRTGRLVQYFIVPALYEDLYAITARRYIQSPLLRSLLKRPEAELLDLPES